MIHFPLLSILFVAKIQSRHQYRRIFRSIAIIALLVTAICLMPNGPDSPSTVGRLREEEREYLMHQCAPAVQGLFFSVGQLKGLQSSRNCSLFANCFVG